MDVNNIHIIFDNPTAVFFPGEKITGRVLLVVSNSIKIKKVKLKFKGEGNVLWREHNAMSRRNSRDGLRKHSLTHNKTKTERYTAKEEYFNHKILLAGGERKLHLKEGEHVYPFSVSLPDNLPSTFEEEYGRVQYTAKVVINIPWDIKKGKEIAFEVISGLNLNDEPSLAEPKILEREKFYCCCCCKSGPMTMIVYVPYTGFVPGQSIPVTVELDNNSNVDVESIKIQLERVLKFKARFPSSKIKSKLFTIVNVCIDGVEKHTSKTRVEQIKIPNNLTIPNLKHCGIITDIYTLNVEACVNDGYINEVISVNLKLGNTPLTIATNAHQFDYSFESLNQSNFSREQIPENPHPPVGLTEPISVPGCAQLVIQNIKLKFRGEANVYWSETESRTNNDGQSENHSNSYSAREEYFKTKMFLVGAKDESQLEVGEYIYPFNFSLPHQLPSTFNGEHGKVCYIAKVKINIPWKKNIEKEIMFKIISSINLNDDPSLVEPKKELKEKFYWCCCCKSGPLTLIACIPYSGFVPGQCIPVTVELDNNSNVDVDTIKIKLDRVVI